MTTPTSQFDDVILWMDKPLFKPYLINHIFSYKGTIQILVTGLGLSLTFCLWNRTRYDWTGFLSFVTVLSVVAFVGILIKIVTYRNIKYWITKDAVYIQTGVINPTVTSIQKDKIHSIDIEKSRMEKKCDAGTIVIDDGELRKADSEEYKVYKKLIAVKNPEKAVRLF